MSLWKWGLTWGGPGLLAWWVSRYSLTAALVIAGLLYTGNVVGLISQVVSKVKFELFDKPSVMAFLNKQLIAYAALRGPILHVPTIRAAFDSITVAETVGNQEALCILDRVAANPPAVWRAR